jgi:hypothetical protein
MGSGTGPEGDDFENLDDSFSSSGILSRAFLNCGEPPVSMVHRHSYTYLTASAKNGPQASKTIAKARLVTRKLGTGAHYAATLTSLEESDSGRTANPFVGHPG